MFKSQKKVQESTSKSAYDYVIKLLAQRSYSEYKLKKKLKDRGYFDTHIKESIDKVIEQGYLREEFYTDSRIRGLMYKNQSPKLILMKLSEEKINVTEEYILNIFSENSFSTQKQIENLLLKKVRNKKVPKDPKEFYKLKQKVLSYLISKGHNLSEAAPLLEEHLKHIS